MAMTKVMCMDEMDHVTMNIASGWFIKPNNCGKLKFQQSEVPETGVAADY